LAAGLSDLLASRSSVAGNSSTALSLFSSSSSFSSDSTSLDQGVGIIGVTTARGDVAFLFLFPFSTAFTAEMAATIAEADCFPTADLILRRGFAAPPASGPAPASSPPIGVLVGLH
jgi:hypothetical protein